MDDEEIWEWIKAEADTGFNELGLKFESWQRRFFEDEDLRFLNYFEREAAQRCAARAYRRRVIQYWDLADAINRGNTGEYIRRWYKPEHPNGHIAWRFSEEVTLDKFGVIEEVGGVGYTARGTAKHVKGQACIPIFPLEGASTKKQSSCHSPAVGRQDRRMANAYKEGKTFEAGISRWFNRDCLMEMGCWYRLFNPARRYRR